MQKHVLCVCHFHVYEYQPRGWAEHRYFYPISFVLPNLCFWYWHELLLWRDNSAENETRLYWKARSSIGCQAVYCINSDNSTHVFYICIVDVVNAQITQIRRGDIERCSTTTLMQLYTDVGVGTMRSTHAAPVSLVCQRPATSMSYLGDSSGSNTEIWCPLFSLCRTSYIQVW